MKKATGEGKASPLFRYLHYQEPGARHRCMPDGDLRGCDSKGCADSLKMQSAYGLTAPRSLCSSSCGCFRCLLLHFSVTRYSDTHEDTLLNRNQRCHEEFPTITAKRELEETANCCLGITSRMNATFLENLCAAMDAVSQGPGSVMGSQTALMTVMRRNAQKPSPDVVPRSSPAPTGSTASLAASGATASRTVPTAAMRRTAVSGSLLATANPLLCSTARFHCKNGLCIDKSFVCDSQNNCQDNSDEESCESPQEAGSGQDYVTSENQLLYYPSITYAIIGSSVIFVLVVAFLALVLHHQRKRNNLMTLPVHRLQHPVLLSRLVVLDHPHHCSITYNVNNGIQYVASQPYHRPVELDSPPSYSEAVLDQRDGRKICTVLSRDS